jgi:O-acetyl-ADP-ribose deacetylase (regulator of RNase III)
VAFPAISTGVYRFPAERAAGIAVDATLAAIEAETSLQHIVFCCFSDESARLHDRAFSDAIANRKR